MQRPDGITKSWFGNTFTVRNRVYMAWLHDMIKAGNLQIPNAPKGFTQALWASDPIELHHFAKEGRGNDFAVVPLRRAVHQWAGSSSANNQSAWELWFGFANRAVEMFVLRDFFAQVGNGVECKFYAERKLAFDNLNELHHALSPKSYREQFYQVILPWVYDNQQRLLLGIEE